VRSIRDLQMRFPLFLSDTTRANDTLECDTLAADFSRKELTLRTVFRGQRDLEY